MRYFLYAYLLFVPILSGCSAIIGYQKHETTTRFCMPCLEVPFCFDTCGNVGFGIGFTYVDGDGFMFPLFLTED